MPQKHKQNVSASLNPFKEPASPQHAAGGWRKVSIWLMYVNGFFPKRGVPTLLSLEIMCNIIAFISKSKYIQVLVKKIIVWEELYSLNSANKIIWNSKQQGWVKTT